MFVWDMTTLRPHINNLRDSVTALLGKTATDDEVLASRRLGYWNRKSKRFYLPAATMRDNLTAWFNQWTGLAGTDSSNNHVFKPGFLEVHRGVLDLAAGGFLSGELNQN